MAGTSATMPVTFEAADSAQMTSVPSGACKAAANSAGPVRLRGFPQFDDVGAAFAPGQDIRVMLIRADDHADLSARREGRAHAEKMDQPVDAGRRARAREDHRMRFVRAAAPGDGGARFAAQPGDESTAIGRFGMRVGVVRQHLLEDEAFHLHQGAAGRDVIGVDQRLRAERAVDGGVLADEPVRAAATSPLFRLS